MARYRIEEDGSSVSIEVTDAGGEQDQLLEAFSECQEGRCTCPTDEYQKLASIGVQTAGDVIRLQLKAKPGEAIDTAQIAACLDYTTAKVAAREVTIERSAEAANDAAILADALAFHGHKCWASTAGVRLGLAAMQALGASRARAKQLHAIVETGDYHGGTCFGDGVQFTTGCTFGKGNIEKTCEGKFAVTLIDKAGKRAVRVAYRPTLQPRIKATPFMQKRAAGVPPTNIPEAEQMEVVTLVWDASADEIMTVGAVEAHEWSEPDEVVRFVVCLGCGELVAEPYARVAEGRIVCAACAGYPR